MSRVLVTRPRADAEPFAAELAARGIATLIEPMLDIVGLPGPPLAPADVQALLFTSANGVRELAARHQGALGDLAELRVFAVGDATAQAARDHGFAHVESAAGDVVALAELVIARAAPSGGALLHIAGSPQAGDLAGQLSAAGFTVDRQVIYEARPAAALSPETADALAKGKIDAVTFFSPRTASAFVRLCHDAGLTASLSSIAAVCLSDAVAEAARAARWRAVIVAARPDQAALVEALEAMTSGGAQAGPWDPEANLPAFAIPAPETDGQENRGEERTVTHDPAGSPPLALPAAMIAEPDDGKDGAKGGAAPAKARRRRSPLLWSVAALLVLLIAVMVIWPNQVRRLVASLSSSTPPTTTLPSASIAVGPPRAPSSATPPANGMPPTVAKPPAAGPAAPSTALPVDLETRLNAVESRIAALLEQPVITPDSLAGVMADQRRTVEDSARAAAQDAARATAKDAAEEAVKAARAGQPDTAAALAEVERRLAALEKAATAFAGLAELERRIGQLEKTAVPLAALGDVERRVAEAERTASAAATASQTAARGDSLTLGLLALRDAIDRGAPFADVLATLRVAAAGDGVLMAEADRLAPMAAAGVPSLAALRERLDELARAAAMAPAPPAPVPDKAAMDAPADIATESRGMLADVWQRLSSAVVVRRIDKPAAGNAADPAPLARAQALLGTGDLAGAIASLDDDTLRAALGAPQKTALEAWLRDARVRHSAEASVGALSRRGLALVSAQTAAPPAAPAAPAAPPSAAPAP